MPGHFATDEWALARFDGTPLYEDPNPQRGWHKEWGSHIFNFGRREVRNFLYANALYWLEEFHADGLRVDGVASMLYLDYSREAGEWTPNKHGGRENLEAVQFLQEMNATVYKRVPGATTIAEESTSWPGVTRPTLRDGLGFGFKWNMGWMHDTLGYLEREPVHRSYHHDELTFALVYAFTENFVLPHQPRRGRPRQGLPAAQDARRPVAAAGQPAGLPRLHVGPPGQAADLHGRRARPGVGVGRVARARLVAARPPRAPRRAPPGQGPQRGLRRLPRHLVRATNDPAGFQWIDANDAGRNVFSFVRRGADGAPTWSACPTSPPCRTATTGSGCPPPARGRRSLNTDAEAYAGSGVGNLGTVEAHAGGHSGQPAHATLVVPPLATVWLRRDSAGRGHAPCPQGPEGSADVTPRAPNRASGSGRCGTPRPTISDRRLVSHPGSLRSTTSMASLRWGHGASPSSRPVEQLRRPCPVGRRK